MRVVVRFPGAELLPNKFPGRHGRFLIFPELRPPEGSWFLVFLLAQTGVASAPGFKDNFENLGFLLNIVACVRGVGPCFSLAFTSVSASRRTVRASGFLVAPCGIHERGGTIVVFGVDALQSRRHSAPNRSDNPQDGSPKESTGSWGLCLTEKPFHGHSISWIRMGREKGEKGRESLS